MKKIALTLSVLAASLLTLTAQAENKEGLRNLRYCEVAAAPEPTSNAVELAVYNTIGLNECPDALWKKLTPTEAKQATGAALVYLNGPRYLTIDGFKNTQLINTTPKNFGGLNMRLAGILHITLAGFMQKADYQEHQVDRETTWLFNAGKPIYELIDPQGQRFAMQSYSIQKVPQDENSLKNLGQQLTLPKGWKFVTRTLKKQGQLKALNNKAIVVQDDFLNTYQKETSPLE